MKQILFILILFCTTNICKAQLKFFDVGINTTFPVNFKDKIYGINSTELQIKLFDVPIKKRSLEVGVNLKYTVLNKVQDSQKAVKMFSPQLDIEYNGWVFSPSTHIKFIGRAGYGFNNLNKNYIHLGYGIVSNTMILNKTSLMLSATQNNLINSKLNFFELGVGIRRLFH